MAGPPRALILLLLIVGILEGVSAGKKKKPCKYNNKKYNAGKVIVSMEDNCVELKCSKKGKKAELVAMKGCDCCKGTQPPIEPPTGAPTGSCDGAGLSASHTMLLTGKTECGEGPFTLKGVTDADIVTILETHNNLRQKVAKGEETLGCPGGQPGASNMKEMKWNCELAEVAQAWAEQCVGGHDGYDDRKICNQDYTVGQNVYQAWNSELAAEWATATEAWYSEVKDMPPSLVDSFGDNTCATGGVIGHYTQVVWAETYEVGCGVVHYPDKLQDFSLTGKVYVCNCRSHWTLHTGGVG